VTQSDADKSIVTRLESIVYGERRDVAAKIARGILLVLSMVYRLVIWSYLLPFRIGIRRAKKLDKPVISVGNITVGGTGKTPTVEYICRGLNSRKWKPGVLSYGYGGSLSGRLGIVSDGERLLMSPLRSGDEPAMLASAMPGVTVLVGKDRFESGQIAIRDFGADVLVLDDGFQVWKLHRDLDIVLINANNLFDNGRTLPAGKLREPVGALRRADCVLITGDCEPEVSEKAISEVHRIARQAEVFVGTFKPAGAHKLIGNSTFELSAFRNKKVLALSSIGNPAAFAATLESLGAVLVAKESFPDHHSYSAADIRHINRQASDTICDLIVTTEKDAVKLNAGQFFQPVIVLRIELRLNDQSEFWEFVEKRLG